MEHVKFTPPATDELLCGIGRYAGITDIIHKDSCFSETVSRVAAKALASIQPLSILEKTPLISFDSDILKGEKILIKSRNLCSLVSHMDTPSLVYGFVLTLGEEIDSIISETQQTSLTEALFLDAAGSFLVEHYASQMENHLRISLIENRLQISSRFSPGYCDWEVSPGQKELFAFLNPSSIGVNILESFMMSPLKSITGIIIAARMVDYRTPCVFCPKERCLHRRQHP